MNKQRILDLVLGGKYFADRAAERFRHIFPQKVSIGKLHPRPGDPSDGRVENIRVENISFRVLWQMNVFLPLIIRDYLRTFAEKTPAIGNCVIDDSPDKERYLYKGVMLLPEARSEEFMTQWKCLLRKTADEFDFLVKMEQNISQDTLSDPEERKQAIERAFSDLAYIFEDLVW